MSYLLAAADLSRVAAGGLLAAVWQGILLAAVVWMGLRLLPKTPAAVRFAIWFAVFVVVAGLPVVSSWPHAAGTTQIGGRGAWLTLDARWSLAIAAVWAAASLVRAGTLVHAALRVWMLWKRATPVECLGGFGSAVELRSIPHPATIRPRRGWGTRNFRGAEICTSDKVDRPTVIGFFAPKILIPTWLLEKLTAGELEQIVLHETGHLGRADDWMNLLQKVALVVFPLNPALAWVERRLCFERELACDERVLRTTRAPKAYAACLATLAEHQMGRRGLALALGALGRESELGRRVRRILRFGETMRPLQARLVLGGAMLGLVGGAVGLERCPQVIGFAAASDQDAMVSVPGRAGVGLESRDGYGYQAVVFHPYDRRFGGESAGRRELVADRANGGSRGCANTPPCAIKLREDGAPNLKDGVLSSKDGAPDLSDGDLGARDGAPRLVANERQIVLRDRTEGPRRFVAARTARWVVVTAWQGEDGSRLVFTTARTSSVSGQARMFSDVGDGSKEGAGRDVTDAYGAETDGPELQQSEEVYPYAAVPVRGGWLVFQL